MNPDTTMQTQLIGQDHLDAPGLCQAGTGSPKPGSISYVLLMPLARSGCHPACPEQGQSSVVSGSSKPRRCPWKIFLIVLGAVVITTLMILLLLWNYKCIVIDRYCEGNNEVLPPLFKIL